MLSQVYAGIPTLKVIALQIRSKQYTLFNSPNTYHKLSLISYIKPHNPHDPNLWEKTGSRNKLEILQLINWKFQNSHW